VPVTETWANAFARAVRVVLWLFALAIVSVAGVFIWNEWRTNVAEFEADLDLRPRDMEEFPNVHEDVAKRVASARDGLAWVNRRFAVNGGVCAAAGAALIGGAVAYRRRRRVRGDASASWRTWVVAVPLAFGLVVLTLAWLATNLRGAIPG